MRSPTFYRRITMFCEVPVSAVSWATGVTEGRYAAIENGKREPNDTERRLIESFLRDRLQIVLDMEGPFPSWIAQLSSIAQQPASDGARRLPLSRAEAPRG
jgi:hypothetical protein